LKKRKTINECLKYINHRNPYIKAAGCLMIGINYRGTGNIKAIKILKKYI